MTIIGAGQADFHVGDAEYNRAAIGTLLEEASQKGVEILTLPELANSGYVFNDAAEAGALSEEIPGGATCRMLADWSRGGRLVVCGLCEREGERLYNSAVVFADGQWARTYRKAHLFLKEGEFFRAGDEAPPVIDHQGKRVGVMICFDWAFPEMARVLALGGAQIILHPSNLVLPYAQQAMLVRSIENRVFTATANRCGLERGVSFSGRSQISDPTGERLAQAEGDWQGVISAAVDLAQADNKQITQTNHLFADRRPELYGALFGSG